MVKGRRREVKGGGGRPLSPFRGILLHLTSITWLAYKVFPVSVSSVHIAPSFTLIHTPHTLTLTHTHSHSHTHTHTHSHSHHTHTHTLHLNHMAGQIVVEYSLQSVSCVSIYCRCSLHSTILHPHSLTHTHTTHTHTHTPLTHTHTHSHTHTLHLTSITWLGR